MTKPSLTMTLLRALCCGDTMAVRAAFGSTIVLDGAFLGRVTTQAGLDWATRSWPSLFGLSSGAEPRLRFETRANDHIVTEVHIPAMSAAGEVVDLPVAMLVVLDANGLIAEARFYFCEKPLTDMLRQRMTSFSTADPVVSTPADYPDVNACYIEAQIAWDHEAIVAQFGPGSYIERGTDRLTGADALLDFYKFTIIPTVPLRVVKNSGIYDGRTFVLEWSSARIPTASGLAAYERDENGQIHAIRMYDNSPWPCD